MKVHPFERCRYNTNNNNNNSNFFFLFLLIDRLKKIEAIPKEDLLTVNQNMTCNYDAVTSDFVH